MRKITYILLVFGLLCSVTACGKQEEPKNMAEPTGSRQDVTIEKASESSRGKNEHILIAYFTWAENTSVSDPDSVDVDATTSASVLMPGNVGLLAKWI